MLSGHKVKPSKTAEIKVEQLSREVPIVWFVLLRFLSPWSIERSLVVTSLKAPYCALHFGLRALVRDQRSLGLKAAGESTTHIRVNRERYFVPILQEIGGQNHQCNLSFDRAGNAHKSVYKHFDKGPETTVFYRRFAGRIMDRLRTACAFDFANIANSQPLYR
jgi:hypothetical protein